MQRNAVRSRRSCVPFNCQTTITEAKISIRESRPNPARATERASMAAVTTTTVPTMFHASVMHSSSNPRRSQIVGLSAVRLHLLSLSGRCDEGPETGEDH